MMTYSMDIQHVDGEVVGRQVHRLEDLVQGHRLPVLGQADGRVGLGLERLLDETQQVLLVHARCGVNVIVHLFLTFLAYARNTLFSSTLRTL